MADTAPAQLALTPVMTVYDCPTAAGITASEVPSLVSPANSDRTVVQRAGLRRLDWEPSRFAAIFSTDGGRLPYRDAPRPPHAVVVRSNNVVGVVEAARFWYFKSRDLYQSIFPNRGWSITDLWDKFDIHTDSPSFLESVLHFISHQNAQDAVRYAQDWCQQHPEEFEILGGDIERFNTGDKYALVYGIFTHGELEQYPPEFLLEVLRIVRATMRRCNQKYRPGPLESTPRMVGEQTITAESKELPPQESMAVGHSFPHHGHALPGLNGTSTRHPSLVSPHAQRPLMSQVDNISMGMSHHVTALPGHVGGQPRHIKRSARSDSNPYHPSVQMNPWGENARMSSGEHMRHPSGPLPNGSALPYFSQMPMGPGMSHPLHPGAQFPPNAPVTSPPMHPSQMHYNNMMSQSAIFPGASILPHCTDIPQQYGPAGPGGRGGQFIDMVHSAQPSQARGIETRALSRRNSQSVKSSRLYDPYGADRPDKAGFAIAGAQSSGKKGGRGNFANNMGRGRKYSETFDRSGPAPYMPEYPDNGARPSGSHFVEGLQPRSFEPDLSVIHDHEYGCNYNWIGPKNTTVRTLFVKSIPDGITPDDIASAFRKNAGITPSEAEVKILGENDSKHAFITFSSTDDARKALQTKNLVTKGKDLHLSVARRYFQLSRGTCREPHRSASNSTMMARPVHYSPQDARSSLQGDNRPLQRDHQVSCGSPEIRRAKKDTITVKPHSTPDGQEMGAFGAEKLSTKPVGNSEIDETRITDKQIYSVDKVADIPEDTLNKLNGTPKEGSTKASKMEVVANEKDEAASDSHHVQRGENIARVHEVGPEYDSTVHQPPGLGLQKMMANSEASSTTSAEIKPESISEEARTPHPSSPAKVALPPSAEKEKEQRREIQAVVITAQSETVEDVGLVVRVQDETTSDDDQKHDLSFHSAQESQPETGAEDINKPLEFDHAQNDQEEPVEVFSKDDKPVMQQPESSKSQKEHEANVGDIAAPQARQEKTTWAPQQPPADTGKKKGAQQTESLNPFAKSNKAQQKKEKQAKKKDKLKEKEKVKTKSVGKEEAQHSTKSTAVQDTKGDKDIDAIAFCVTNETGQIQDKDEEAPAQQSMAAQESQKATLDQVPDGTSSPITQSVPSHEKHGLDGNPDANTAGVSVRFAVLPGDQHAKQEQGKKKSVPPKIAVPSLELLKKRSPPTSAATPHTAYFSATSCASNKDGVTSGVVDADPAEEGTEASSAPFAQQDSASVSSSTTLRGTSPPPTSASPTTKEFHTPLQTPLALDGHPAIVAKKKKKPKKKKKRATDAEEDGSDEAFRDQLSQITNKGSSYYSLRGPELPAQEVLGKKEDKGAKSLIRQMQAYVKEKASTMARVPESTWSKEGRKPVEKMAPAEAKAIVERSEQDSTQAMYDKLAPTADGSPHKVLKAGVVPFFRE